MVDVLMDKLSLDIDNVINKMNDKKKIDCSKSANLITKLYKLTREITTKCELEELKEFTKFLQNNLYRDTIGKTVDEKKKQLDDIYEKFFFTIPNLISSIKLHIKNPEFLKEFKPLLEPFSANLAKYICERYGPDKVEETINKMFSGISSSVMKGVGDGIIAFPLVGNIASAVKGVAGVVGNGLNVVNGLSKLGNNKEFEQADKIVKKYNKKGGGGLRKNKIIKKCSKVIMFILINYLLNKNNKRKKTKTKKNKKIKIKTKRKKNKRNKTRIKKNKKIKNKTKRKKNKKIKNKTKRKKK